MYVHVCSECGKRSISIFSSDCAQYASLAVSVQRLKALEHPFTGAEATCTVETMGRTVHETGMDPRLYARLLYNPLLSLSVHMYAARPHQTFWQQIVRERSRFEASCSFVTQREMVSIHTHSLGTPCSQLISFHRIIFDVSAIDVFWKALTRSHSCLKINSEKPVQTILKLSGDTCATLTYVLLPTPMAQDMSERLWCFTSFRHYSYQRRNMYSYKTVWLSVWLSASCIIAHVQSWKIINTYSTKSIL